MKRASAGRRGERPSAQPRARASDGTRDAANAPSAQVPARDYWLPGTWPSEPTPVVGGGPYEGEELFALELGALTYRLSERVRATGDPRMKRLAPILWLGLVAETATPGSARAMALQELYGTIGKFLDLHAPEAFRTDHVAIKAVFAIEEMQRAREILQEEEWTNGLGPIKPPPWFPAFSDESLANGAQIVAQNALDRYLSPQECDGVLWKKKPPSEATYGKIATVLVRYLSWCWPGPAYLDAAALGRELRRTKALEAEPIARVAMRMWLTSGPASRTEEERREHEKLAKDLTRNLFGDRLRQQVNRAPDEATDEELGKHIDGFKRRFAVGAVVVPALLRWAAWYTSAHASPGLVGDGFALYMVPGDALGSSKRRSLNQRVRRAIAARVATAVEREAPAGALRLAEVVCGAIGVPLRKLGRTDFLREFLLPLGVELRGDKAVDHFESWLQAAAETGDRANRQ